ncbi:MAG TPA: response regulator transcription factor [Verrucomicrobiae bacterium]|nr:response regulator transcription factor [Verrucomicrobiae bacterium]
MNHRPRVLLADDHAMLLEAFKRLLEPDCEVVGTVTDGRALLEAAPRLKPEVIVLDIAMPRLNGLDAGRQLRRILPESKLVFLTSNEDPDLAVAAFRAGASGYLLKNSASSELFTAIQNALAGKIYLTPLISKGVPMGVFLGQDTKLDLEAGQLTTRQREVLQLLAEGRPMKEVADVLKVTPRTVAFHKYTIMEHLGINTSAELVQYAVHHGLVQNRRA